MSKTFKSAWNVITTLLVFVVVVLALLLAGPRFLGLHVFTVLSGSMEPVYHTGALIYVKEIEDTRSIPDGTVITYMASEDTIVTHRIVAAVPDEQDPSLIRYRTKGDANDVEDGALVHYKNILGTPVFTVPALGYLANYIQNPPGSYMIICFGALFILLLFLPELLAVFLEKEEEEEKTPKPQKKPERRKKPEAERKAKPEKAPRKRRRAPPEDDEDFPYEALFHYKEQPHYSMSEPEPEIYEEPHSDPLRSTEDDWLAALLADVDLDDASQSYGAGALPEHSRDKKHRGGAHCVK